MGEHFEAKFFCYLIFKRLHQASNSNLLTISWAGLDFQSS